MIPNHAGFIEAIHQRKKVSAKFYSTADSGVLERVCAPLDYGPGSESTDGLHRYWLWDYAEGANPRILGLLPQQIVDLHFLGEVFDPAQLEAVPWPWTLPREWNRQPAQTTVPGQEATPAAAALASPPGAAPASHA